MRRNEYRHGAPEGLWARCARSPRGETGVAFGWGPAQTGFLPEAAVDAFLTHHKNATGEKKLIRELIERAARDLPTFKQTLRAVRSASVN